MLILSVSHPPFVFSHFAVISPYDVRVIAENGTLSLNCTLYDAYARNHSLSSRDILWQRGSPFPDTLHPDSNARVAISHPDRLTSTLTVRNLAVDDSAAYRCFVPGINDSIGPRPICSVDVTIAGELFWGHVSSGIKLQLFCPHPPLIYGKKCWFFHFM